MNKSFFALLFFGLQPFASFAQANLHAQPIQTHNNDAAWITVLFLCIATLYWVAMRNNPIFLRNKFQLVMHSKDRGSFYSASVRSQSISYILFFLAYLLSFSLFIYQLISRITEAQPFTVMAISFAAITIYHLLKYLIYISVIKYIFIEKNLHNLVSQTYLFMNIVLGIFLFPINILLTYSNHERILNVGLIAGLVFFGVYVLTLSSKLFYIFLKDVASLFYMILYLCTLEILPIWVPVVMGLKTLIINE